MEKKWLWREIRKNKRQRVLLKLISPLFKSMMMRKLLQKLTPPYKLIIALPKFLRMTSSRILSQICRLMRITPIKSLISLLKRKLKMLQSQSKRNNKSKFCKNNRRLQPRTVPMLKLRSKLWCLVRNQSKSHKTLKRLFNPKQIAPKRTPKNRRKNSHRKHKNRIKLNLRCKRMPLRRLMLEKLRLLTPKIPQKNQTQQPPKKNPNLKKPKIKLNLLKLLCK